MKTREKKQRGILRRKMQRIVSSIIGYKVIVVGFYERIAYPEERGRSDISWGLSIFYIDTRDLKEKYIFFLKESPIYEKLSRIYPGLWLYWCSSKGYFITNKRKRIFGYATKMSV